MSHRDSERLLPSRLRGMLRNLRRGTRNALELVRKGRLGTAYHADHAVVHVGRDFRLRRYTSPDAPARSSAPLLLVPPLMVTANIYDVSPEVSAVTYLVERGVDVWVVDFGAPEREHGGMERTLDDHVLAVDEAIDKVRDATGRDVHLGGYSQGGLFVYQTAAYRRSEGLASVITFGSPVDLRRNLPVPLHESIAEGALRAGRALVSRPLDAIEGLPGALTSTGFKLVSARKEVKQVLQFFAILHDRAALERREPKRRFLGGEGFVAWPGPALRKFIDEVLVANRMASGGIVINRRTVTLADITVPILYFLGTHDEFARPRSVRAIRQAARDAEAVEISMDAGHFGLVVGRRALQISWPAVVEWIAWHDGGPRPEYVATSPRVHRTPRPPLTRLAAEITAGLWERIGDISLDVVDVVEHIRWQLPRVVRLRGVDNDTRISVGRILAEQATDIPDEPFFLWHGRAFSYAEANRRVDQVATVLVNRGVSQGDVVGVLMGNHPDYLTTVTALSRIGAVAALLPREHALLRQALDLVSVTRMVADPAHASIALELATSEVLCLGGRRSDASSADGAVDLDALLDPRVDAPPAGVAPNPGRGADAALVLFPTRGNGSVRAARVSNRRWAVSALGAAAAGKLKPTDTVYCCLPLGHPTAITVAVAGAMAGGTRLALADTFEPARFWDDVRRYGATVVYYAGDMIRRLVLEPPSPGEHRNPVRLFTGTGLRQGVWRQLAARFKPRRILEFYASTEGNAVLGNLRGEKVGAVGTPFLVSGEVELVRYDFGARRPILSEDGRPVSCLVNEPGVLMARLSAASARFDAARNRSTDADDERVHHDLYVPGDAWLDTRDILRADEDGDFWYVGRVETAFSRAGRTLFPELIDDVLEECDGIRLATTQGVRPGAEMEPLAVSTVVLDGQTSLDARAVSDAIGDRLRPGSRPDLVVVAEAPGWHEGLWRVRRSLDTDSLRAASAAGRLWRLADDEALVPCPPEVLETLL